MRTARRLATHLALASLGLAALAAAAGAAGSIGDVYITSDASDIVRAYDGTTGAYLGDHATSVGGSGQLGIHFGSNGRFLVGSFGGGVDEYDTASGAFIKTYSPGGGWQWTGIYAPNGNVYIGSMGTNDVREYDSTTGAFVQVLCPVVGPADMRIGPNGNLYICAFIGGYVVEVNASNGAILNQWSMPANSQPNDIAFLPNGEILVTSMGTNVVYRYSPGLTLLGSFAGTGWDRPHGIEIGPLDGRIYVVDGVTTQVHVFDPTTFAELNAAWRNPDPEDKIVDLAFRPDTEPTAVKRESWSGVKRTYR